MIIVDTNVVVSGLLTSNPGAPTAGIVDDMIAGRLQFILSSELLDEYRAVLLRPHIARLHGLDETDIDTLLTTIVQYAVWRDPALPSQTAPDPGDNHLWALLEAEPAARLVTGDGSLLEHPIDTNRVLTPAQFASERQR